MNEAVSKEVRAEEVSVQKRPQSSGSWAPVIVMLVAMPLISYAVTEYLLVPRLKQSLAGAPARDTSAAKKGSGSINSALPYSYSFQDIVVNLAGSNGTRYLKVSYTAFSASSDLQERMGRHRDELIDMNIRVLSAKTIAELEAPGARNLLRNDLIENLNRVLGGNIVEQVYFTDFIVQ